jgi:hypothetical protein
LIASSRSASAVLSGSVFLSVGEADELVELGGGVGELALEVQRPGDADQGLVVELVLGVAGGLGVGGERGGQLVEVVVDLADAQPGLADVLRTGAARGAARS